MLNMFVFEAILLYITLTFQRRKALMNIREIIEQIDPESLLNSIVPELKAKSKGQIIELICPICLSSEKSAYIWLC